MTGSGIGAYALSCQGALFMKRSSLSRGRSPMKRKTGVPKVNRARKRKRFETDFGGEDYHAYITQFPCDICGVKSFTVAAHLTSRGAGGKASDLAPLCGVRLGMRGIILGCHTIYDERRWLLPEGTEQRLREIAAKRWAEFHARSLEGATE